MATFNPDRPHGERALAGCKDVESETPELTAGHSDAELVAGAADDRRGHIEVAGDRERFGAAQAPIVASLGSQRLDQPGDIAWRHGCECNTGPAYGLVGFARKSTSQTSREPDAPPAMVHRTAVTTWPRSSVLVLAPAQRREERHFIAGIQQLVVTGVDPVHQDQPGNPRTETEMGGQRGYRRRDGERKMVL